METEEAKNKQEALRKLYYEDGYQRGIKSMYHMINRQHPELHITRKETEEWLKKQVKYQTNMTQRKTRHIKPILANRPYEKIQIDLIDYSGRPSKQYNYIFMMIDIHSRYLWAKAITRKTDKAVSEAFTHILSRDIPMDSIKIVMTDKGSEFGKEFDTILGIHSKEAKHIKSIGNLPQTQGIIERTNKTIKHMLQRMVAEKKGGWSEHLEETVKLYNESYHQTIKGSPIDIKNKLTKEQHETLAYEMKEKAERRTEKLGGFGDKQPLKKGDKIRTKIRKGQHEKHATKNWSDEIYTVRRVFKPSNEHMVTTYEIEDSDGTVTPPRRQREDLLKIVE
jgi:transposase InsO family protein